MQQTLDHRRRILMLAAMNVDKWKFQVIKLKSIYHIMNMLQLDEINEFQSAECWLPQNDIQLIKRKLNMAADKFNSQNNPIIIVMKQNEMPPTFNRTNKFTKGFQVPFLFITYPIIMIMMMMMMILIFFTLGRY